MLPALKSGNEDWRAEAERYLNSVRAYLAFFSGLIAGIIPIHTLLTRPFNPDRTPGFAPDTKSTTKLAT